VRNLAKRLAAMPIITNPHMLPFTFGKIKGILSDVTKRPLMPLKSSGKKRIFKKSCEIFAGKGKLILSSVNWLAGVCR